MNSAPTSFTSAASHSQIGPLLARYAAHYSAKYATHMNPAVATRYAVEDVWNANKHGPSAEYIAASMLDDLDFIGA